MQDQDKQSFDMRLQTTSALSFLAAVVLAAGVGNAAEPKTAYFFGNQESASGFVAWIVSPRGGLCFTDGEEPSEQRT